MTLSKIAIIPARSGSKGLPNKNILLLIDKPLIAYTIEAAIRAKEFDRVIVSTDSLEYKAIAERYGAEVIMRSAELASDTATSFMVVEDVLKKVPGYDYFVLLQPTSPFRDEWHIRQAVNLFEEDQQAKYLVSVVESPKGAELVKPVDASLSMKHFDCDFSAYRRQDHKEYSPNGAIFIGYNDAYLQQKHFFGADSLAYIMSKPDSVDIDDRLDFEFAILRQNLKHRQQLNKQAVLSRIHDKAASFTQQCPITLIGHSIFDYWQVESLNGQTVSNLGIAGINSEEYNDLIIEKGYLKSIGDTVLFFSGTNDIVVDGWKPENTVEWAQKTISWLTNINPSVQIYFIAVPPVLGRIDRDNNTIRHLNVILRNYVENIQNVTWVELSPEFYDRFGNLNSDFTYDGLHFTEKAYVQLERDIVRELK